MEIREEVLAKILNGVETVLDTEGMPKEFRRQKLQEVAGVFKVDSDTSGRLAQEIVQETENIPMLDLDGLEENELQP